LLLDCWHAAASSTAMPSSPAVDRQFIYLSPP
jgi:hypothetical protein